MSEHHESPVHPTRSNPGRPVNEVSLVRSREQLSAATVREPVATVRLEKFVVTEQRTIVVDVAHQDVRLVFDTPPTTGSSSPTPDGDEFHARADTVTLFAEEIEVIRRWVPVETARLELTTVHGVETVTDTVRTEHIDTTLQPSPTSGPPQ